MRIRWIELNGFKSFPERTKIELNEGVTCFVGPNGTGKSNIVDAFRWILGEHNPRVLRGEKMEEVIFQGSPSKKEKGLAEVVILLVLTGDPQNGTNSEVKEVEIKRRFYRTGESYFIINGKPSRLKDIKEIFLSEGVDIRTYSIIDQFKLNEILFKPSSRKALLEECAGISIYKFKKTESEAKLQSARENLQRIEDILGELKNQYSLLERQAIRAEKYKKIIEELKNLELKVSKKESDILIREIENLKNQIKHFENSMLLFEQQKEKVIENRDKKKNKVYQLENTIQQKEKQLKLKETEIAQIEKELALLKQEQENKRESIKNIKEENTNLSEEIEKNQSELNKAKLEVEQIEAKILNLQREIINNEESLLKLKHESLEIEEQIESERKLLFNLSTDITTKKNEYNSLSKTIENNKNRFTSLITKKEEVVKLIDKLNAEINRVETKISNLKETLNQREIELRNFIDELDLLEEMLESSNQKLIELRKKEAIISGKIETITSEIWQEDSNQKLLIDFIDVSPEAEELVEILLEDKLRAVVIENIEEIKASNNRKFFFLKKTAINESNNFPDVGFSQIMDFVKIKDSSIGNHILKGVFIVDNLKIAQQMQQKFPNCCFLTKKGEVLFPDGFIKIGKASDLLKKKRILEELKANEEITLNQIKLLEEEILKIKQKQEKISKQIEEKREGISEKKRELVQHEHELIVLNKELEQAEKRQRYMENEEKSLQYEINLNIKTKEKLQTEIEALSQSINDIDKKIEELKTLQGNLFNMQEHKQNILSGEKIELSSLKERLNSKNSEIARLNENIKKLSMKKEKNQRQIEYLNNKLHEIAIKKAEQTEKYQNISIERENLRRELDNIIKISKEERKNLDEIEKEYQKISEEIQKITSIISEKKAKESEFRMKLESLWNEIYNLYGVDILREDIEPASDKDSAKDTINKLKTQLKEIGPVDMEILKEYEEVKERYEFLFNQKKDIKTSIEELEEAIKKINSLTRKKLRETLDLLREKFNSTFKELFDGGRAEILLTDENNILDAELEIKVQPPGKKLNNINLLSGGEKTLTALAFIFACLSIRPSPICILDEVDATLDDPNTLRFRKLIRELSDKIQFLIITHNKLIMEAADYLYGVTMQEEGVSKVISIQLRDAEVYT